MFEERIMQAITNLSEMKKMNTLKGRICKSHKKCHETQHWLFKPDCNEKPAKGRLVGRAALK